MADLDEVKVTAELPTVSHPGLQWAFIYMAQSYFAAVHVVCGEDDATTAAVIRQFVQNGEAFQDIRDAFEAPSADKQGDNLDRT